MPTLELLDLSSNAIAVKETPGSNAEHVNQPMFDGLPDLAARATSIEALDALRGLLTTQGLSLNTLRLANCQLCSATAEPGVGEKGVLRSENRGISALAAALKESQCHLIEVTPRARARARTLRQARSRTSRVAMGGTDALAAPACPYGRLASRRWVSARTASVTARRR